MPVEESSGIDARGARDLFPGLAGRTFLDAACVSLAPRTAIDAVEDFLVMAATCEERDASLHHVAMDKLRGRRGAGRGGTVGRGGGRDRADRKYDPRSATSRHR